MKEANSKTSTGTNQGAEKRRDNKEPKKKAAKKAKKKAAKPKPAKPKPTPNPNQDKSGKFVKGHKVNEVWTEAVVLQRAQDVWKTLTTDSEGNAPEDKNYVRANDIKYLYEALIMNDITKQRWSEWSDKFTKRTLKDDTKEEEVKNPHYSPTIAELFSKIKMLLECRLSYSGGSMDMLHLKKHFDYREEIHVDNTTKGESINNPFYELLKATGISSHQKK